MRINYFHHEFYFFKETLFTSFSLLQKRIFAIALIAIGCLVACMVYRNCNKKIQADKPKKDALDNENLIKKINENLEIPLKDEGFKIQADKMKKDALDNENLIKKINENPKISLKDMGFKDIDQVLEFAKISGSKLQNINIKGY